MGKQTKDLERQKSRDVVNELSTVFTTSTRTATQRPQQQPQQQTQIVTGAPIRGPQPDEFIVSEELPEALAKLEAAQKARHQSGVNVDVEESKKRLSNPLSRRSPTTSKPEKADSLDSTASSLAILALSSAGSTMVTKFSILLAARFSLMKRAFTHSSSCKFLSMTPVPSRASLATRAARPPFPSN